MCLFKKSCGVMFIQCVHQKMQNEGAMYIYAASPASFPGYVHPARNDTEVSPQDHMHTSPMNFAVSVA